jgi:hypothetical protein
MNIALVGHSPVMASRYHPWFLRLRKASLALLHLQHSSIYFQGCCHQPLFDQFDLLSKHIMYWGMSGHVPGVLLVEDPRLQPTLWHTDMKIKDASIPKNSDMEASSKWSQIWRARFDHQSHNCSTSYIPGQQTNKKVFNNIKHPLRDPSLPTRI